MTIDKYHIYLHITLHYYIWGTYPAGLLSDAGIIKEMVSQVQMSVLRYIMYDSKYFLISSFQASTQNHPQKMYGIR